MWQCARAQGATLPLLCGGLSRGLGRVRLGHPSLHGGVGQELGLLLPETGPHADSELSSLLAVTLTFQEPTSASISQILK